MVVRFCLCSCLMSFGYCLVGVCRMLILVMWVMLISFLVVVFGMKLLSVIWNFVL